MTDRYEEIFKKYKDELRYYLDNDNREINYQNSLIMPYLRELIDMNNDIQNNDIRVVDVSTLYKNWDNRDTFDRGKIAKHYTPDLLIARKWNIKNKDSVDIDYLALIEIKVPTAKDLYHTKLEVNEYCEINKTVILTDGFVWSFYENKKTVKEIDLFNLSSKICKHKESKRELLNKIDVNGKDNNWQELCDYIRSNVLRKDS
ncbi:hypothetical protein EDD63_10184 [Breznakia blatticola]|uniref:Uncharacterized protein n=1 Tax=Breznakia blatticola TaxID=1754012 RepID=A0A4R8A7A7_9FIRM|nr:hypothetical protein [Breznakia blatticola]TDW26369.1 hypothetical protein EDD63_10184 [Breznakia blatticola]